MMVRDMLPDPTADMVARSRSSVRRDRSQFRQQQCRQHSPRILSPQIGRHRARLMPVVAVLAVSLLLGGCGGESTSDFTASSAPVEADVVSAADLVLSEPPQGELMTPTAVKELGGESIGTIIAGRIDAGDLEPFRDGELAFILSELPPEGHGGGDPEHADNCPFCKRKLENAPKAIVQFLAEDGSVRPGDARQTLSLRKGDVVYVTGTAQFNPAVNTVIVNATGVFKKPMS
jgi:hypothetical protein